jgi:hypothetical protein
MYVTYCDLWQLAYGGVNRGVVFVSPICKYTIYVGSGPVCSPPTVRFAGGCQCPSANHSLVYGENCEEFLPFIHFWNRTVITAPMLLGQGSAALLRLDGVQGILKPPPNSSLSVQVATYNISIPARHGALGLDKLGPHEPVSLLADVLPAGLLFRAGLASLALEYNPGLVVNASAVLALRFNESTASWEAAPAAHDKAKGTFSLPLAASGRYALFEPRPAVAAPPPPPPGPLPAPSGLYAEASLAVLSLSAAFAFLFVGVPILVRVLERPESGKAECSSAATTAEGGVVVVSTRTSAPRRTWRESPSS